MSSRDGAGGARRAGAGWHREPLLHFLVIGTLLFALYGALNRNGTESPRRIVVSAARVDALAENFARTWMRPPAPAELQGLVDDYVAEEVYYREAVAAGLDRDDTVIRRRLRQKMEFVTDDLAASTQPTDAELQAFLAAHRDRFALPQTLAFEQVFVSRDRRGAAALEDARGLLAQLRAGRASPGTAGDPTLLPRGLEDAEPRDIEDTFGQEFATAIAAQPVGEWAGPVTSSFGVHLVRVTARTQSRVPSLAEAREVVQREWEAERLRQAKAAFLAELLAKYDVTVEGRLGGSPQVSTSPSAGQVP